MSEKWNLVNSAEVMGFERKIEGESRQIRIESAAMGVN